MTATETWRGDQVTTTPPSASLEVGFTGTRERLEYPQERRLGFAMRALYCRGARVWHHGDCVGGDAISHDIASSLGYTVVIHPPEIDKLRAFRESGDIRTPKAYWARNRDIVDAVGELVACPRAGTAMSDWRRSGTWYTIRHAYNLGMRVHLIYYDGSLTTIGGAK